jgi:heterodisulfide reductase subunit A
MSSQRIGVYVCHCGGNIGDYVDVEKVVAAVRDEPGVVVARSAMFTCSDATQQEILQDIREQGLDGLVVASCSPKLHQFTFRDVARRGDVNPYQYTQVNIREQCSWAHTDDRAGATDKAVRLVRAGIARTRASLPLEPIVVETVPRVLVVGAGVAGLRAAIGLADVGLEVVVVERETEPGGRVAGLGDMYPHGRSGRGMVDRLLAEVDRRPRIRLLTDAELVEKKGSFGNFTVSVRTGGGGPRSGREPGQEPVVLEQRVGAVIVATGADTYQPREGEYGWGLDRVVTLPDFERMSGDAAGNPLTHQGRPVRSIVYVYCVGSRQGSEDGSEAEGGGEGNAAGSGSGGRNRYCSRYCCNAAGHAALQVAAVDPQVRQYHLFRDVRTYGRFESLYADARRGGSVYVRFDGAEPPVVDAQPGGDGVRVRVKDLLTAGEELEIPADLVVLVTGMVPRSNEELGRTLRIPVGQDGFYNEIHPKLRPTETVVDGVLICGSCQGPKNSGESVASALAASAQSAAILKKGFAELDPLIATVDAARCDGCGSCYVACPFDALEPVLVGAQGADTGMEIAAVKRGVCKGCGACVPACPSRAIDLLGYTDEQIRATIDALLEEVA